MSNVLVATPFSHLFEDPAVRERFLRLSDIVELRRPEQAGIINDKAIYHCEASLIAKWSEAEREELKVMSRAAPLSAVSTHLNSRFQHNEIVGNRFEGVGEPYTEAELRENAARNSDFLRECFGPETSILVENNNDLGTDAYALITEAEFIRSLMEKNELELLLDVAHAKITAHNKGLDLTGYLQGLDVGVHCVQVHLSRHGVNAERAYDVHDPLQEEDWFFFQDLRPKLPRLLYATVEYYRDVKILEEQLLQLRRILDSESHAQPE